MLACPIRLISSRVLAPDAAAKWFPACPRSWRCRSADTPPPSLAEQCRPTQEYLRPVASLPGVSIRTHQTTLYASQYRFDGCMLVNNHTAAMQHRPLCCTYKRVPAGRLFGFYDRAFERVWATGQPLA